MMFGQSPNESEQLHQSTSETEEIPAEWLICLTASQIIRMCKSNGVRKLNLSNQVNKSGKSSNSAFMPDSQSFETSNI